jgi:hypothetical protein
MQRLNAAVSSDATVVSVFRTSTDVTVSMTVPIVVMSLTAVSTFTATNLLPEAAHMSQWSQDDSLSRRIVASYDVGLRAAQNGKQHPEHSVFC